MKIFFYIIVAAVAYLVWKMTRPTPGPLLTTQQRNLTNNAILDSYSLIVPPIAQLARVPLTNGNLRMVDPVMPSFVYPNGIYQNGNN